MSCIANLHCCTCDRSLHINGDMYYVSKEAARFGKVHQGHNIVPLVSKYRPYDNGTEWDKSQKWFERLNEQEKQEYLQKINADIQLVGGNK